MDIDYAFIISLIDTPLLIFDILADAISAIITADDAIIDYWISQRHYYYALSHFRWRYAYAGFH
jgi:hypothetical protein